MTQYMGPFTLGHSRQVRYIMTQYMEPFTLGHSR